MKKILSIFMLMGLMMTNINAQSDNFSKKLIGKWCNPYTYEDEGVFKGFHFKKNGKCTSIGIKDLDLKTWEVKDGRLIIKGKELDEEKKTWIDYEVNERIEKLENDSLYVIAQEKPFKMRFLYMKVKAIKKAVTPKVNNKHLKE